MYEKLFFHFRKQPPETYLFVGGTFLDISYLFSLIFKTGFLENWYLFGSYKDAPGKSTSVSIAKKRAYPWKIGICSSDEKTLPGKMSICYSVIT